MPAVPPILEETVSRHEASRMKPRIVLEKLSMGIMGCSLESWRVDDVKIRPNGGGRLFVQTLVRRMVHRDPHP
jgi:hypothetical protein